MTATTRSRRRNRHRRRRRRRWLPAPRHALVPVLPPPGERMKGGAARVRQAAVSDGPARHNRAGTRGGPSSREGSDVPPGATSTSQPVSDVVVRLPGMTVKPSDGPTRLSSAGWRFRLNDRRVASRYRYKRSGAAGQVRIPYSGEYFLDSYKRTGFLLGVYRYKRLLRFDLRRHRRRGILVLITPLVLRLLAVRRARNQGTEDREQGRLCMVQKKTRAGSVVLEVAWWQ